MATITDAEWEDYKSRFNKSYANADEETMRRNLVAATKKIIDEHNLKYEAGEESYSMGLNDFSDKTPEEKGRMFGGRMAT
ncbi:protein CTLA-2-beta-like [Haematobia irritans]|uniref:protein CTLA-2-beta-like n=1 Tax=Haematobia irritans TaxID=7368 RepID=UPI003F4F627C